MPPWPRSRPPPRVAAKTPNWPNRPSGWATWKTSGSPPQRRGNPLSAEAIDGAFDVLGLLDGAKRQLDRAAEHDPALADIADALAETAILASDIAGRLSSYLSDLDADGGRDLEAVQERRAELGALVRKYGPTLDDTIDHLETGSDRLLELDNDTDRIEQLRAEVAGTTAPGRRPRRTSSPRRRSRHGAELADQVSAELAALAMPDALLTVEISEARRLHASPAGTR